MMKKLLPALFFGLLLLTALSVRGQSNEGREFWLGFMEHRDVGQNTMVVMITSRVNTSGTISIPGRGFSQSFAVTANNVTLFELPDLVETRGSEFINNNAIHIVSNDDISVYMHQYFGMRSEASVVLPRQSVGHEYYVVAYTGVPAGGNIQGFYPAEFLVVANEDETTVHYTLTGGTQGGKTENTTHSITLNRGEVFQVRADDALTELTGTYLIGDKDFSLFAGTSWSQVPLGCFAMDNLLEQMYPVSTWGTKYVASGFVQTSEDLFRILASENGTLISIQGDFTLDIELNAGEYYDFRSGEGAFIEGNKPITVAQYIIGSGCNGDIGDPSMVILNTVEQIRDTVTLFNSGFFAIDENYINVICKAGEEDLVYFDNQNVVDMGISFNPIGEEGAFLYATVPSVVGAHTLYTEGCGIIAMAYGYGNVESYAYSGGASFTDINENPIPEGGCLNDTILFDTGLPEERYAVQWDLGDGTQTADHVFEHQYPTLGSYPLSLIVEDLCFDEIDTLYRDINVTLRQDLFVIEDQSGCEGSDITLGAFDLDGARFEWTGPNDFVGEEQFPVVENASLTSAGIYEAVGNISGCKTFPVGVAVEVFENPRPFIGEDTVLCTIDGDRIVLDAGDYQSFMWQDGSPGRTFQVTEDGLFHVTVVDENLCVGSDSMTVIQQCPTRIYMSNVFSPNRDGINDVFGVEGLDIISLDLKVFDRWGQLVFETRDLNFKWDGTFNGEELLEAQYVWILDYEGYREDGSIFGMTETGTVLLVR